MLTEAKNLDKSTLNDLKQSINNLVKEFNEKINTRSAKNVNYNVEVKESVVERYLYWDHNGQQPYTRDEGKVIRHLKVKINICEKDINFLENT